MPWPSDLSFNLTNPGKFSPVAMYIQSGSTFIPATSSTFAGGSGGGGSSTISNFLGTTSGPIAVSGVTISGNFTARITGVTGNQSFTLPSGIRSFSVAITSGSASLNGITLFAGTAVNYGNVQGFNISNSQTISGIGSGAYSIVSWEL